MLRVLSVALFVAVVINILAISGPHSYLTSLRERTIMLDTLLSQSAERSPGRIAVIQGERRVTYGELESCADSLAAHLADAGMRKGDRVGIVCRNSPEYIAAFFGIPRAGGVAVDINYQDSLREIKTIINHCTISTLIVDSASLPAVVQAVPETPSVRHIIGIERRARESSAACRNMPAAVRYAALGDILLQGPVSFTQPDLSERDLAAIVYTSGTTGKPKGVMLSHGNFLANARSIVEYLRLGEEDRVMAVLPFCYSYGKSLLTTHVMAGGTLVLENSFVYPNVVFDKMLKEEVTGFAGVPSTFAIILNRSNFRNYRFPKLRYLTQAGGPMPPQHARMLSELLPAVKIYIMYGQTEATARLTYLEPGRLLERPGSIGRAIPGVEIEVVQEHGGAARNGEGELVAAGKNIMLGYWNDPEETGKVLKDGRLYTGDLGRKDEDGYLYLVGRRSDMIKSGAHRIGPKEIEDVIHELQEVHEVSVVGVPDDILGEAVRAVIVLKEGQTLDAAEVRRSCQAKLAPFKIPKEVLFVESLPKTNTGKVMRYLLKSRSPFFAAAPAVNP